MNILSIFQFSRKSNIPKLHLIANRLRTIQFPFKIIGGTPFDHLLGEHIPSRRFALFKFT